MTTSHPDNPDDDSQGQESLECLVACIRARGEATPRLKPPRSPEAIGHLIEHVKSEQPLSLAKVEESNKQWAAVEAEIRRIDEEDEAADRE